jgi:hypothetical protein
MSLSLPPTSRNNEVVTIVTKSTRKGKQKNVKRKKGLKPNQKKQNRKTKNNGIARAQARAQTFYLSPCSQTYLKALVDPFMLEGGMACIPDEFDFPSTKRLVISRGTFNAGTQGIGFLLAAPNCFVNDAPSVIGTIATYNGAAVQSTLTSGITGVGTVAQNFPFASASFGNTGFSGRWVGVGVRIRYLGTELNRSGRCIPVRINRQGQNLQGAAAGDFLAQPEIPSMACTRTWKSVTMLPRPATNYGQATGPDQGTNVMISSDTTYSSSVVPYLGTAEIPNVVGFDLGWWIDGCVPGNAFEYEIYGHYEFCAAGGGLSPDGITPSHSDAPGVSAIRNALESNLPVGDASAALNHALKFLKDYAPSDISHVAGAGLTGMKLLGWH